jgi:hypothetical protein
MNDATHVSEAPIASVIRDEIITGMKLVFTEIGNESDHRKWPISHRMRRGDEALSGSIEITLWDTRKEGCPQRGVFLLVRHGSIRLTHPMTLNDQLPWPDPSPISI